MCHLPLFSPFACLRSFDVFVTATIYPAQGQVLVVKKGKTLSLSDWVPWATMWTLLLSVYGWLWVLVGPVTAAFLLGIGATLRRDVQDHLKNNQKMSSQEQVEFFTGIGFLALAALLCFKLALPLGYTPFLVALAVCGVFLFFRLKATQKRLGLSSWHVPSITRPICVLYEEQVAHTAYDAAEAFVLACLACCQIYPLLKQCSLA